jgi:translocation protein SEC63
MYYYFFNKTPSMALKRVIMILAASLEFEKKHNGEIVERSTDNEEVPHVSTGLSCSLNYGCY